MSEQIPERGSQPGVKTPDELRADVLTDPGMPEIQAETIQETPPATAATVTVVMGNGIDIRVPMQTAWRKSAMDFMRVADFDSWAESVLSPADLGRWDEWMDADPPMGELMEFFEAVGKATGEAAGLSRASRRQLQRTQRR